MGAPRPAKRFRQIYRKRQEMPATTPPRLSVYLAN